MTQKPPLLRGSRTVTPLRPVTAHSLEAEPSVLGGLLLDNRAWSPVVGLLAENDFYQAKKPGVPINGAIGKSRGRLPFGSLEPPAASV